MIRFFELLHKFKRYLLVGGFNTLLSFLIMYIGSLFGINYLVYTAMGYLTTIVLSFFMNLRYTFKVRDRTMHRLLGFITVSLTNLAVVECIEYQLVETLLVQKQIAIIAGMSWYVAVGFLVNNYIVYRNVHLDKAS
jgi:putative flippase GtrA